MIKTKRLGKFTASFRTIGEYTLLMRQVFSRPARWSMFFKQLVREIAKIGLDSILIVMIISFFIGTVITIQLAINISSPMIPRFTIGYSRVFVLHYVSNPSGKDRFEYSIRTRDHEGHRAN